MPWGMGASIAQGLDGVAGVHVRNGVGGAVAAGSVGYESPG